MVNPPSHQSLIVRAWRIARPILVFYLLIVLAMTFLEKCLVYPEPPPPDLARTLDLAGYRWKAVASAEDAARWQEALRSRLFDLLKMTDLVSRNEPIPLAPRILSASEKPGYVHHEVEINSTPGRPAGTVNTRLIRRPGVESISTS